MSINVFGYSAFALFGLMALVYLFIGYRLFIKKRNKSNSVLEIIIKSIYVMFLVFAIYYIIKTEGLIIMLIAQAIFQALGIM